MSEDKVIKQKRKMVLVEEGKKVKLSPYSEEYENGIRENSQKEYFGTVVTVTDVWGPTTNQKFKIKEDQGGSTWHGEWVQNLKETRDEKIARLTKEVEELEPLLKEKKAELALVKKYPDNLAKFSAMIVECMKKGEDAVAVYKILEQNGVRMDD